MMWFRRLFVLISALFLLSTVSLSAPAADPSLDATLKRLDQASSTFKGLTADIRKMSHTDVVNVDDVDSGTIVVKRFKPHDTRIRIDLTNPRRQSVTIGEGKVQVFYPQTNEA